MTIRDDFIDAMSMIDDDLITSHIRKKHPTKAQRIHRYVMAAGIYAAAILVVAVILPFVIGKGEDPTPVPGKDPVTVETVVREPDDPEVLPTENVTFNGCELSITLDKAHYDLDDAITATVVLENKGDETIILHQGFLGNYLDHIIFLENREMRESYSSDSDKGYPEAIQQQEFKPGESVTHTVQFTPGKPLSGDDPVAKIESLWEITAFVYYYTDTDDPNFKKPENTSVTIEVPHGDDDTDTELRRINVTDIDARYNGTDPENLSDTVTLDEVKAIISAARQAYAEYDVIVLADGTLMSTKAKLRDLNIELNELYEHERDTLFEEYDEYFNNMFTVIEEMLDLRFPENSILREADPEDYGLPCYYALNLPDTGFATAEELIDAEKDSDAIYAEWILTNLMKSKTVYYFDSNTAEEDIELLYPTAEEFEIWQTVEVWRMMGEVPETDDSIDADIESIVVGIGGETLTIGKDSEYYERIMILANEMISAGAEEITDAPVPDIAGIKQYEAFAEFVYNREVAVLAGEESVMSKRVLFSLIGYNAPAMILSEDDGYSNIRMYSVSMSDGMIAAIRDMISSDETTPAETTAPAPETTAPPPAVQPAVTVITTTTPAPEPVPVVTTTTVATTTPPPVTAEPPAVEEAPAETTTAVTAKHPESETSTVTTEGNAIPYLESMADYGVTYFNGCRYIVGIDKTFYNKGDSITVTVILQNNGTNTLHFKNDYLRNHFLDHVEFALGQGYFYGVYNREGSSEDWLEPGEVWVYTETLDLDGSEDMINWYNNWEITAQVEYTIDGTEYTKRVSVSVPHVNVF